MNTPLTHERRRHFRVYFTTPLEASATLVSINNNDVNIGKSILITIIDLSAGGISFKAALNMPVETKTVLNIQFRFEDEHFIMQGCLIWKSSNGSHSEYGLEFIDLSPQEEQRLVKCLNQNQMRKTSSKKSQFNLGKGKISNNIAEKVIEILPYPAFLVSADRVVIKANKAANELAINPVGEKCHLTVKEKNTICSYCQVDEMIQNEEIVCGPQVIKIKNKKYLPYWYYLEDRLFIHYFKEV